MSWCTIESDPGVFNEMLTNLGVKDVAVEEIYSLEEMEQQREPSYGLIFLFKWKDESDSRPFVDPSDVPDLFFARQVVQNACATQALLSVILNTPDIDIGEDLREFKLFTSELDSESRGFAIGGSDKIRITHNSFARAEPFFIEELRQAKGDKEDVYHFVAYIPFKGKVYE
jgi:ubiquitin carboxyl-terminal hydrolase L5